MGFVYFVGIDCDIRGRVKIGYSGKPEKRIAGLQTASAFPLIYYGKAIGSEAAERRLHDLFKDARIVGEWFHCTREVGRFIQWIMRGSSLREAVECLVWEREHDPVPSCMWIGPRA